MAFGDSKKCMSSMMLGFFIGGCPKNRTGELHLLFVFIFNGE